MAGWKVNILTIFPEMFPGPLGHSIAGKALSDNKWEMNLIDIRDYAKDKHSTVDDKPFGGGTGMVMKPDVIADAIDSMEKKTGKLIYMSPRGKVLTQEKTEELIKENIVTIICGRYEGIDQRVIEEYGIEEISIGDYIVSGGEIAAFVLIDACVRQISGVLSKNEAISIESFGKGGYKNLLEYPHYTRPAEWRGRKVPQVLLSGNHADIECWRRDKAVSITQERRADLWKRHLQENADN